jgi:helicase
MPDFQAVESREIKEGRKPFINIAFDTISMGKQALMFVNSKKRAEKTAEEIAIARQLKGKESKECEAIADKALKALSTPTRQCKRLAECLKKGIAFHHAGLVGKQKSLIEDSFREGKIKVICATPTLAAGLDLPAFRVVIRDLTRFSHRGMAYIPVLEYFQQIGRAGRPKYDKYGEAIVITSTEKERDYIIENYLYGEPEDIYSKLAVEPILRSYVLSLIVTRFATTYDEMMDFFSKTFWAHQFQELEKMELIIDRIVKDLGEWGFIETKGEEEEEEMFVSADALDEKSKREFRATPIGKKVSEAYVDPYTANHIIEGLKKAYKHQNYSALGLLHLVCHTLEMRPLLRVRAKEEEDLEDFYAKHENILLEDVPSYYDMEYEEFLRGLKTAKAFNAWLNEKSEEHLYEKYRMLPGEQKAKIDIADWLLYSSAEFCRILEMKELINELNKLRLRLKHGVKDELIPLIRLKQIGRVRARKLFNNGYKSVNSLKKADINELARLVGKSIAIKLKKQLTGEDFEKDDIKAKEKKKGQQTIHGFLGK